MGKVVVLVAHMHMVDAESHVLQDLSNVSLQRRWLLSRLVVLTLLPRGSRYQSSSTVTVQRELQVMAEYVAAIPTIIGSIGVSIGIVLKAFIVRHGDGAGT